MCLYLLILVTCYSLIDISVGIDLCYGSCHVVMFIDFGHMEFAHKHFGWYRLLL